MKIPMGDFTGRCIRHNNEAVLHLSQAVTEASRHMAGGAEGVNDAVGILLGGWRRAVGETLALEREAVAFWRGQAQLGYPGESVVLDLIAGSVTAGIEVRSELWESLFAAAEQIDVGQMLVPGGTFLGAGDWFKAWTDTAKNIMAVSAPFAQTAWTGETREMASAKRAS